MVREQLDISMQKGEGEEEEEEIKQTSQFSQKLTPNGS